MYKKQNYYKVITINKKSKHNYFLEKKYCAGIKLLGYEIKSIRLGKVNIQNAHIRIQKNEIFIINMIIDNYDFNQNNINKYKENRAIKLLLNRQEIEQIKNKIKINKLTIIPFKLYFDKHLAKLEIFLAKGKKNYDKRNSLKEKTIKQDIQKNYKIF